MPGTPVHLSREDDKYIRSRFVSLEWIAQRSQASLAILESWQRRGLFPLPTYVTEDGKEWYSRSYAELVRKALARRTDLKSLFSADYLRAAARLRKSSPPDYEAEIASTSGAGSNLQEAMDLHWRGFISGEYGVCLRVPWVPCMLRKGRLMRSIEELCSDPRIEDPGWRVHLRRSVDTLERLEMPFAQWDRIRFGTPVSRDTHIDAIRLRFPEVFGRKAGGTFVGSPPADNALPGEMPC
jgi:hypothetical protein